MNEISESVFTESLDECIKRENGILNKMFNNISMGIVIIDYKTRAVLFTNKHLNSIVNENEKSIILNNIYRYLDDNVGKQKKIDITHDMEVHGEGKKFIFNFTTYPVGNGTFIVFLSEITSGLFYFLTMQENQYYNKLSELIAEMAHEIGNPLSGINTSLQVLQHNLSTWPLEKVGDYIERTIGEIDRLSGFLKRMREVSHEDELDVKSINLKAIVDKVLLRNDDLLNRKGIRYHNDVNENTIVLADENAFYQIILNLLINSLDILTPGQEIKIYVEEIDEFFVKLVYRNNGPPIPLELLEKIFSPLYSSKSKRKGIGLAISLKLMIRMGGTIKAVMPEGGSGAKFILYLSRPEPLENSDTNEK